jgi:hypothetical protein
VENGNFQTCPVSDPDTSVRSIITFEISFARLFIIAFERYGKKFSERKGFVVGRDM